VTTRSRTVSHVAILAATVVGVVLLAGSLGISVPPFRFDLRLGPTADQPARVDAVQPPSPAPSPATAPPSPPLLNPAEPLLLARGDAMGMNDVVGYRFGERVPPPRWPPADVRGVPDLRVEPVTVRPTLTNAEEVERRLTREYPAVLRDAGIGGVSHLWIHLDTRGVVDATLVHETSGYEAIDRAAVNVARTMLFDPAMSRGGPTTAWVQIPIRFQAVP
jgi:TonB family protein